MSHEIRTPMNAIMGFSHLALQTQLTTKQHHYVDKIHASAHALLGVINDILDFSKIEAGKLEIENTTFSLDEVLDNLASLTTFRAEEKGLEILFNRDIKIPDTLIGDPLRLGQILINLTGNAVKFTEQGEIIVSAKLHHKSEQQIDIEFSVKDTGIGIDPEELPRLFKPFTQLDGSTTRRYGGSGLGLSICFHLVDLLQGKLVAESKPGVGSTFRFIIPFEIKTGTTIQNWLPEPNLRGLRVLLVDDNPTAVELLGDRLRSFSFEVTSTSNSQEAFSLLSQADQNNETAFQLVIIDWRMPGMNGIEAGKLIKQNQLKLTTVPSVILITAYGREEVMLQVEEAGLDGILIKPVSPSVLFDTVIRVLTGVEELNSTQPIVKYQLQKLSGQVLLVEDNMINQQVAKELLESMGIEVVTVNNGRLALEALEKGTYDLVLMDLQMPEMDGYEATAKIRANQQLDNLPVVAMTAHAMTSEREQCLAAGMNEHVPKPIDPQYLNSILSQWLEPASDQTDPRVTAAKRENIDFPKHTKSINLKWGLERIGGNRQLYLNLLNEFLTNHSEDRSKLTEYIEQNNHTDAKRLLHTLEGVSANIGAHDLAEKSKALHYAMTAVESDSINNRLDQFRNSFQELINSLHDYLDSLETGRGQSAEMTSPRTSELIERLGSLDERLASGDPDAKSQFQEICTYLPEDEHSATIDLLRSQISDYDFDFARETLAKLIRHLR
jgi:CheY-like chemotaxis protein